MEQLVAFFTLGRVGALSYGHIAFSDGNEVVNALKLSQSSILEGGENPGSLRVVNGVSTNTLSALSGSRKLHGYVVPVTISFSYAYHNRTDPIFLHKPLISQ